MQIKNRVPNKKQSERTQQKSKSEQQILSVIKSRTARDVVQKYLHGKRDLTISSSQLNLHCLDLIECEDFQYLFVNKLTLYSNHIKSLINLKLPYHLTYLSLGCNNIESIQILQNLEIPELQTLKLYGNKIISLKSLRRCRWPKLKILSLEDNPINDLQSIATFNKNWNDTVVTTVELSHPTNKLFQHMVKWSLVPKCHPTKLLIKINFQ